MLKALILVAASLTFALIDLDAADAQVFKCGSLTAEASKTAIRISGYAQKAEWNDVHELQLDFSSILSINAFKEDKNPRVSITSKERIIDNGNAENRIYWVSFRSLADLDGFMEFAWKGKAENPAAVPGANTF